jgi:hypothetical protein
MWYAANLLFKSTHSVPSKTEGLWEESIRLIRVANLDEAKDKAISLGRSSELSYSGSGTDEISWTFAQVERIYEIDNDVLTDGIEVFSRYLRSTEVSSILAPFEELSITHIF